MQFGQVYFTMKSSNNTTNARYRNWATIIYPESASPNWKEYLADLKTPIYISPLHNLDINPTGEPKKAHYHVIMMFDGKKSAEQVHSLLDPIGAVGLEVVNTKRGYARYLCHLDNPEKHQYSVEDVTQLGGADFMSDIGLPTDKYKAISEMIAWCNDNGVIMYCDLFDFASKEKPDWFRILCDSGTLVVKEYLKSKEYSMRVSSKQK